MKICMISDTFWPRINGASASIASLSKALRKLGQEVYIVAPDYSQLPTRKEFVAGSQEQIDGVFRLPAHSLLFYPEDCMVRLFSREYRRLIKQISQMDFDIIHIHTPLVLGISSLFWPYSKPVALVHTFLTLFEEFIPHYFPFCYLPRTFSRRFSHWFSLNVFHWFCNHFDRVIAPSNQVANLLQGYHLGSPHQVIPLGIDLDQWTTGDSVRLGKEWQIAPEEKLLLYVGRVGMEKGLDFLLRAMRQIHDQDPSTRLVIVGQGPAENALKKMTAQLQLSSCVRFVGYKPHAEIADAYAAADLFLFVSQTESQGLVTIEALASGTPVVAVRGPGTLDVLENEKGGLLSPPDETIFAKQVIRLLQDPSLYAQKVKETRERAKEFSAQNTAGRVLSLYQDALDSL